LIISGSISLILALEKVGFIKRRIRFHLPGQFVPIRFLYAWFSGKAKGNFFLIGNELNCFIKTSCIMSKSDVMRKGECPSKILFNSNKIKSINL
jgi:hypothetical protein